MERLAPYLPLVVTGIGIEAYLDTTITHFLHNAARVFNTRILLTTAQEKDVELTIERLGIGQHARNFLLQIKA